MSSDLHLFCLSLPQREDQLRPIFHRSKLFQIIGDIFAVYGGG